MIGIALSIATLAYLLINYPVHYHFYCNLFVNFINITISDHHRFPISRIDTMRKIIHNCYD